MRHANRLAALLALLLLIAPLPAARATIADKPWLLPAPTVDLAEEPPMPPAPTPATRAPEAGGDPAKPWLLVPAQAPAVTEAPAQALDTSYEGKSTFSVLLIGTDAYTADEPGRSDAMVVATLDLRTHDVKLVSFLRDLYVKIPGKGKSRLNAAYVYGGAELLRQTLADNFGVTVDRALTVDFTLTQRLIDRLGGVVIDVSEKERKQLNAILAFYNEKIGLAADDGLVQSAGEQLLTGRQALSYSRIRKIDSDFQRVQRQRNVFAALLDRAREADPLTLFGFLMSELEGMSTDLTLADALALLPHAALLDSSRVRSLTVPVAGGYQDDVVNGMMVLSPNLKKNTASIAAFLGE